MWPMLNNVFLFLKLGFHCVSVSSQVKEEDEDKIGEAEENTMVLHLHLFLVQHLLKIIFYYLRLDVILSKLSHPLHFYMPRSYLELPLTVSLLSKTLASEDEHM